MAPLVLPVHRKPSMKTWMTTPLPNWKLKNSKVPSATILRERPSLSHSPLVMFQPTTRTRTPMRMNQKPLSQQSLRLKVSQRLNLEPKSTQSQKLTLTPKLRSKLTQMPRPTLTLRLTPTLRSTPTLRLMLNSRLKLALRPRLTLSVVAILVLVPRQG